MSNAAGTILEGMAVTFSHLFREPITIQYPDKTDRPFRSLATGFIPNPDTGLQYVTPGGNGIDDTLLAGVERVAG